MAVAENLGTSWSAKDKNGNVIFSADYSGKKPKIIDNRVGGGLGNVKTSRKSNKSKQNNSNKKQNTKSSKGNTGK